MHRSRRDFVTTALAAAAATLASRTGADEGPAAASRGGRAVGPNEKIRVAVIGMNTRGGAHIDAWMKLPDAELVAVSDCDPAGPAWRASQLEGLPRRPRFEQDFRRLLDDPCIDVVSLATPNHWHALMSVWAMQAGKDVYVEKPCGQTLDEGRVITSWARKLGRICQMGAQGRSMPGIRQAVDFIHGGGIGRVRVAHAVCFKRRPSIGLVETAAPLPPGIDFDLWAGPAPAVVPVRRQLHYDWHWDPVTGNGELGNTNPHQIDKARWGLGKADFPRKIVSIGGRLGYVDNGSTANSIVTLYAWDDALIISDVRGLEIKTPPRVARQAGRIGVGTIWWGTEGYVVTPTTNTAVAFDYDGREIDRWSGGSDQLHFANFLAGVRSRRPSDLHLDIEEGHVSSGLAHLGNVSWALGTDASPGDWPALAADDEHVRETFASFADHLRENGVDLARTPLRSGRLLEFDSRSERTGDPDADACLTREYRAGYELPRA